MNKLVYLLILLSLAGCAVLNIYRLTTDITGKVTIEGSPVAGVKVIFNANSHWFGRWDEHVIITDENGFFTIPHWTKISSVTLPHQPVIEQELVFEYKGRKYDGWRYTRMIYSESGDPADGALLDCELTSPVTSYRVDNDNSAIGVCVIER
jgi:hypothetical protein